MISQRVTWDVAPDRCRCKSLMTHSYGKLTTSYVDVVFIAACFIPNNMQPQSIGGVLCYCSMLSALL